eukprot:364785-Chlamydomonas_euryale.AAC.8
MLIAQSRVQGSFGGTTLGVPVVGTACNLTLWRVILHKRRDHKAGATLNNFMLPWTIKPSQPRGCLGAGGCCKAAAAARPQRILSNWSGLHRSCHPLYAPRLPDQERKEPVSIQFSSEIQLAEPIWVCLYEMQHAAARDRRHPNLWPGHE